MDDVAWDAVIFEVDGVYEVPFLSEFPKEIPLFSLFFFFFFFFIDSCGRGHQGFFFFIVFLFFSFFLIQTFLSTHKRTMASQEQHKSLIAKWSLTLLLRFSFFFFSLSFFKVCSQHHSPGQSIIFLLSCCNRVKRLQLRNIRPLQHCFFFFFFFFFWVVLSCFPWF